MTPVSTETLHASCVAIDGLGVLIEGRSGAGKSDLALRLIDRGATLVSDDCTVLTRRDGRLCASPPANIAGQIEVRGLGIVKLPFCEAVQVHLLIRLVEVVERMPIALPERQIAGIAVPEVELIAFEASAAIKAELALARIQS